MNGSVIGLQILAGVVRQIATALRDFRGPEADGAEFGVPGYSR